MSEPWEWFMSLLFPHKCFLCGQVLAGDGWLCGDCALPSTEGELCPGCGKRADECVCSRAERAYSSAAAPFYYTDGVEYGIHRFKYSGRSYYAPFLAGQMAECARRTFKGTRFDCIVYVPLHPRKKRQRGFCQTGLLARELEVKLRVPVRGDILKHTGERAAQAGQRSWEARNLNAGKSFTVHAGRPLEGQTVLLVDDVLTTGATARRCAGLLKQAGAASVCLLTAATTCRKASKK